MMKSLFKASAALAVLAGTSVSLGQTYCNSPALFIPDDPSVMDTISVSGGPVSISAAMAVTVNINHTWDADLTIVLVHNGATLNLTAGNGGAGDNFINTRFIDGSPSIIGGIAPFTGDYSAEGGDPFWAGTIVIPATYLADFTGFNGMDANGTWDLVIDDTAGGDQGTLNNWCIDFSPGAPPPPPPPPPGDDCTVILTALDGATPFDTTAATTDAFWPCAGGGKDLHYTYTATSAGLATFSTCGSGFDTAMMLGSACGSSDYGCLDDGPCGLQQTMTKSVTLGEIVHITLGGYAGGSGTGVLTISTCTPPTYNQPGAGTNEEEPCDSVNPDITNGGCNSIPPIWGDIDCGETILGTAWCNANVNRDTDVFEFTLAADATVTFTGQAEFPALMFVLSSTCPWTVFGQTTTSACGVDISQSLFLAAGSYNLWMGTNGFGTQVNCGAGDRYWVTMTVDSGCPVACDGDVNCDFALDGFDVEVQEKAVGGDMTDYCQADPDFNGDFALDGFDVEAVEIVVGGGPCP